MRKLPAVLISIIILCLFISGGIIFIFKTTSGGGGKKPDSAELKQFADEAEFLKFIENAGGSEGPDMPNVGAPEIIDKDSSYGRGNNYGTYVQVDGIDEPDTYKTDGKYIFRSTGGYYAYPSMGERDALIARPEYQPQLTKIDVSDPGKPKVVESRKDIGGEMLIDKDNIYVLESKRVVALSKDDLEEELWEITFENNSYYSDARIVDGNIYVFTNTNIYGGFEGCDKPMLKYGNESYDLSCTDIYYWPKTTAQTLASVIKIDASSGKPTESKQVLVDYSNTVYVSTDNIYIASSSNQTETTLAFDLLLSEGDRILPKKIMERIRQVDTYDISDEAKELEIGKILEEYFIELSEEERLNAESEFEKILAEYAEDNYRNFSSTQIVRLDLKRLDIKATGKVPGTILNQFSLDEYENNLRIATHISAQNMPGNVKDENDIYILNSELKVIGELQGLGIDERIYSARFMGDTAYLVTFKQIDPFYVLDLSNPKAPQLRGELKIPGYSSFLHQIDSDRVLGVGREGAKLKFTIFDVGDKDNPAELDTFTIENEYSELEYDHKGFGIDADGEFFFVPANHGYIISFEDNELKVVYKSQITPSSRSFAYKKGDTIYRLILGGDQIEIVDQDDWKKLKN